MPTDAVVVRSRGPTIHGNDVGPWEMERVGMTTFVQRDAADLATEQLTVVLTMVRRVMSHCYCTILLRAVKNKIWEKPNA